MIVTLLITGIKPLIIDEPEAHLYDRLVAEYFVELIRMKKTDIQIIFATHNSNFVIFRDAELIHILDVHMQMYTKLSLKSSQSINFDFNFCNTPLKFLFYV